uniref:Uncharacterized protein n=1 Tax=Cajanus cajan TaxID=3821 RepID=A0A151TR10_CAJCA|nr:hypothetical protein KK1_008674 [Cajanus cajan]
MNDLHPISLCSVIYKFLSQVLANRLKPLLPKYITLEQSAFVTNRSINDNFVVPIEIIHYMKYKTKGKVKEVALKIHMNKAYGKMDLGYIHNIMLKMGFAPR